MKISFARLWRYLKSKGYEARIKILRYLKTIPRFEKFAINKLGDLGYSDADGLLATCDVHIQRLQSQLDDAKRECASIQMSLKKKLGKGSLDSMLTRFNHKDTRKLYDKFIAALKHANEIQSDLAVAKTRRETIWQTQQSNVKGVSKVTATGRSSQMHREFLSDSELGTLNRLAKVTDIVSDHVAQKSADGMDGTESADGAGVGIDEKLESLSEETVILQTLLGQDNGLSSSSSVGGKTEDLGGLLSQLESNGSLEYDSCSGKMTQEQKKNFAALVSILAPATATTTKGVNNNSKKMNRKKNNENSNLTKLKGILKSKQREDVDDYADADDDDDDDFADLRDDGYGDWNVDDDIDDEIITFDSRRSNKQNTRPLVELF